MAVRKEILVLLDAHAVLHRAFHALPAFSSPKGEPTGALYGFSSFLLKILRELKPDYVAAAYDLPVATFRHAAYDKYKIQRAETAPDLTLQIKRSYDILKAFSIPVFEHPRYEADDILGTLVQKTKDKKKLQVIIASGDLDTLQLVEGSRVKVYTLRKGLQDPVLYDEAKVRERFGFSPKLLPDFKGLKGDPSDNIKGVAGIGDKTASELIQKFGSLEKILARAEKEPTVLKKSGVKDRVVELLRAQGEEALFSKTLAEIRRDAPVKISWEELLWKKHYQKERAEALFKELGFSSLLSRLPLGELKAEKEAAEIKLEQDLAALGKEQKLWWYFSPEDKKLYAVSEEGKIFETALREGGTNIFFDAKSVSHFSEKIFAPSSDLKISAWLLYSTLQNPSLTQVVHNFLPQEPLREEEILRSVRLLPKLSGVLEREIEEKKLSRVLEDIELPLIPVLCRMEREGILLDRKFLKKLSNQCGEKLKKLQEKIWKLARLSFNINSPRQLAEVLFDKMKLEARGLKKTEKGARSTRESELLKLRASHPIVGEILAWRELSKLKSTYLDALPKLCDAEGRVRTTFDQTGTVTGRLSSFDPNLQNIPIRSEFGREIRKAFVAKEGFMLAAFDYSQLELRIAAIMSGDEKMTKAFEGGKDIHAATAAEIFNVPESKVTEAMRRDAKTINFGILYGMGVNTLSQSLEIPHEKAQAFLEEYFSDFKGVADFIEKTKEKARERGYVETLFGRRRYLPEIYSQAEYLQKEAERMAVNAPIQGTAADMVKLGMIRAQKLIDEKFKGQAYLLLQIHDELLFEVKKETVREFIPAIKKILEGIYKSEVPLTVDVKIGPSWGDMKKL